MKRLLIVGGLLLCAAPVMAQDHTDVVRAVKADLLARGVNLSGPCGAFRILNTVAQRLAPRYGLLRKGGGNRAVPQPDGSCLSGDEANARGLGSMAGYATDYLIDRVTFFGYDILGDGGGANAPQWAGPETAPDLVARNRANFAEPLNWPPVARRTVKRDFDGDGRADLAVYRPSEGTAYIKGSTDTVYTGGLSTDVPVPADYDGDGKTDPAIFRVGTAEWLIGLSSNGSVVQSAWGTGTDKPVPADYDGDGRTDIAVFRPSTGIWYVIQSSTNTPAFYQWGLTGDIPVPGDYDGDGKVDVAVFRPSTGIWYVLNSSTHSAAFYQWGLTGDIPVPADFDGDAKTDLAVFRPSTGIWYVVSSKTGTRAFAQWGLTGDIPVPGDFDGDGKADITVFRPATGIWYIVQSSTGAASFLQWGLEGDIPIQAR